MEISDEEESMTIVEEESPKSFQMQHSASVTNNGVKIVSFYTTILIAVIRFVSIFAYFSLSTSNHLAARAMKSQVQPTVFISIFVKSENMNQFLIITLPKLIIFI